MSSTFAYSPSYGNELAQYGDGDGWAVDESYGNYGNQTNSNGVPFYLQPSNQQLVPVFGTQDYYQGGGSNSGLIPANQSLGYTNASDSLGLVPNYQSGDSAASFSSGGMNALGSLGGGMGTGSGGMGVAGGIVGGVGAVVGSYDNATTDTTGSVIGGAVSGAEAGAAFGPWGMAIGAVVGGIAGFFGSKSKKNQEKKAFQQQEQLAVLPAQQQEANYLQNEGLKQKAISNYASGYTPGGFQYTNGLLGGKPNTAKLPSGNPSLPNFNVSPTNVVPGSGDKSLGIAPQSTGNNGVNLNPHYNMNPTNGAGIGATGLIPPGADIPWTPSSMPMAPGYSSDKTANSANLAAYQKNYAQYLTDQNQQASAQALSAYTNYYG